ncbi:MAG: hypothetical protein K9K35_10030 [Rhodoferax sp.]|nr:hypothetical protein [Rhodoferax sp.]
MSRGRVIWTQTRSNKKAEQLARNPVFRAVCHMPMQERKQTDLALASRVAFDAVQNGTNNESDRDTLVCMVNVAMVMASKHCSASDLADQHAAQDALLRADCRVLLGKRWAFDGPGRVAMLRSMDSHEQMIAQLGQGMVTDAVLTVGEMRAAGQVHRVEVVKP